MRTWSGFRMGGIILVVSLWGCLAPIGYGQPFLPDKAPRALEQFDTDLSKSTIDLSELRPGGPSKDGIPSIDDPAFVPIDEARAWIEPKEPVIALEYDGTARAYPLQVLMYHEIVNDSVGGTPVAVTFCPLCYSAIAFVRTLDGEPVTFGVSGLLRNSDLVMYDRKTETLWQQFTGKAIVGSRAGTTLEMVPSQLISFRQFQANYPDGTVLSRDTGYDRPYGRNPYAGYDDISSSPFAFDGPTDGRLPPKEKVIGVEIDDTYRAYPHAVTSQKHVIHDTAGDRNIVIFHAPGAVSALHAGQISDSKSVGSTGVFQRDIAGKTLEFTYAGDGRFRDNNTESLWTITGRAVDGPLTGKHLQRVRHGDYFAFAWLAFRPDATVYGLEDE